MEPIAYVADAESVFVFHNETRPTSAPSTHIGPKGWKCQRLRLSQSVEVRPSREPRQKDPHHQPELPVQRERGQQRNRGSASGLRLSQGFGEVGPRIFALVLRRNPARRNKVNANTIDSESTGKLEPEVAKARRTAAKIKPAKKTGRSKKAAG